MSKHDIKQVVRAAFDGDEDFEYIVVGMAVRSDPDGGRVYGTLFVGNDDEGIVPADESLMDDVIEIIQEGINRGRRSTNTVTHLKPASPITDLPFLLDIKKETPDA